MKQVKLCVAVAVALLAMPFVSSAQDAVEEESSPIAWTLAATSDYVFRGVSQTQENPTGQAGITYTSPIGIYAGTWASGVDFGGGKPDYEYDLFAGYGGKFNESIGYDVMVNRYGYYKAAGLNYTELLTSLKFLDVYKVGVAYTDDVYNTDTDSFYYSASAAWPFGTDWTFGLQAGFTTFDDEAVVGAKEYTDYGITLGKSWGAVSALLGAYGTDGKGRDYFGDNADNRVALTVTVGM